MTLFTSETHQELWRQHHCERCWQPDEAARREHGKNTMCPIWAKAIASGRKPVEWERKPRADEMVRSIVCHAYQAKPAQAKTRVSRRDSVGDVPMFDVVPHEVGFVPVDGWPDNPERPKGKQVDHQ